MYHFHIIEKLKLFLCWEPLVVHDSTGAPIKIIRIHETDPELQERYINQPVNLYFPIQGRNSKWKSIYGFSIQNKWV